MSFDQYEQAMIDKHREWYKEFGSDYRSLGWGSVTGMNRRFMVACSVLNLAIEEPRSLRGLSVLDVGCGFGDLLYFAKLGAVASYVGIDLIPEFVDEACVRWEGERAKLQAESCFVPQVRFERADVFKMAESFDVVFALGVAWLEDGREFLLELMRKCLELSKVAAVVSVTSEKTLPPETGWNLLSSAEFARLGESVSERFILRRDYWLTDMMVYLYKDGFARW